MEVFENFAISLIANNFPGERGDGYCFTNNRSQQLSIVENAKAGETSIRNWYISCDDASYKSPEHF